MDLGAAREGPIRGGRPNRQVAGDFDADRRLCVRRPLEARGRVALGVPGSGPATVPPRGMWSGRTGSSAAVGILRSSGTKSPPPCAMTRCRLVRCVGPGGFLRRMMWLWSISFDAGTRASVGGPRGARGELLGVRIRASRHSFCSEQQKTSRDSCRKTGVCKNNVAPPRTPICEADRRRSALSIPSPARPFQCCAQERGTGRP